jgi:hypothetical protein
MGVDQAVSQLASVKLGARLSIYRQLLQKYGRGSGMDFYDRVTHPLVNQLVGEKLLKDAQQVINFTRLELKPEPKSMFDRELTALESKLR